MSNKPGIYGNIKRHRSDNPTASTVDLSVPQIARHRRTNPYAPSRAREGQVEKEGIEAFHRGDPDGWNPYPLDSQDWHHWRRGWSRERYEKLIRPRYEAKAKARQAERQEMAAVMARVAKRKGAANAAARELIARKRVGKTTGV